MEARRNPARVGREVGVVRLALGGAHEPSNLRLACRWCNAMKSDRDTVYDADTHAKRSIVHSEKGAISVPLPYWVVRVLVATDGQRLALPAVSKHPEAMQPG
jgi:hypothetical protein